MTTKPKAKPQTPTDEQQAFTDLRVIEFGVENFMRVRTVVVRPSGPVVELSGRNRQGKTSVLRALISVFAGKDSLPSKPIRTGEKESRVWTVLGRDKEPELTIEEQLTLKDGDEIGRKLIVTPADGRSFTRPQELLDRLYAPIAFAPFEFARKPPKEQLEVVKALVPGVDFADMAAQRKEAFDERTVAGRDRDRAKARYDSILVPADTPAELVDTRDLWAQHAGGKKLNDQRAERARRRELTQQEAEGLRDEAEQLRARAATLDSQAEEMETKLAEAVALPEVIDLEAIEGQIAAADATNEQVRKLKDREAARQGLLDFEADVARLTSHIDELDKIKTDAIAAANLPIPGLELGDEALLLNGLPLDQASGREKIEVGVRVGLAINPDLKLIVVEEGALLDDDGIEVLTALAQQHGFLVVIERVTNGEKVGVTIEDGEVVS